MTENMKWKNFNRTDFEKVPVQFGHLSRTPRKVTKLGVVKYTFVNEEGKRERYISTYFRIMPGQTGGGRVFERSKHFELDNPEMGEDKWFEYNNYLPNSNYLPIQIAQAGGLEVNPERLKKELEFKADPNTTEYRVVVYTNPWKVDDKKNTEVLND